MQRGNAVTGNPRPPQYLSRHAKVTATTLAQEAQETITAVRKVLLVESKPCTALIAASYVLRILSVTLIESCLLSERVLVCTVYRCCSFAIWLGGGVH